ncbi:MAG: YfbR-like 5'-deoxynucleotidase [Candidatus Magasanikbacteria bacterium]
MGILSDNDKDKIINFATWMREILIGMQKHARWGTPNPNHQPHIKDEVLVENILEHTFKGVLITQLLLALEEKHGDINKLNPYALLQCAVNHDFEESENGDTLRDKKTDDIERKGDVVHIKIFDNVIPPTIRPSFPLPIDRDTSTSMSQDQYDFWEAIECLGYVWFAWEELRCGRDKLTRVFSNQKGTLCKIGEKFISVRLVTAILYEAIEEMLPCDQWQ